MIVDDYILNLSKPAANGSNFALNNCPNKQRSCCILS